MAPLPNAETLRVFPTEARRWIGYAFALSIVIGSLTGAIVATVRLTTQVATARDVRRLQESVDRIESAQGLASERATLAADLGARLNGGAPSASWPSGVAVWTRRMDDAGPAWSTTTPWPVWRDAREGARVSP